MKCGGSAKKIQLSSHTAVAVKEDQNQNEQFRQTSSYLSRLNGNSKPNHVSTSNYLSRRECKKCQEIIHNELLDNITRENALVCKHSSGSNISLLNPGLLIIEKEANLDSQTALLNSHITPHSHMHITHQKAKQMYLDQAQNLSSSKKHLKLKKLPTYEVNDDNDYILMQPLNKSQLYKQPELSASQQHKLRKQQQYQNR